MFERIYEYELLRGDDRSYRPRAYASVEPDGRWAGWLVFFPLDRGSPIAPDRETVQSTRAELLYWAAGLTPTYLEGALDRALRIASQPPITAQLAAAEFAALGEAAAHDSLADLERERAESARREAETLRAERLAAEAAIAAADQAHAELEAAAHELAADRARAEAADADTRVRRGKGRRR